jgi:pimeloyl-ACP methyl ester carboxylesterase
VPELNVGGRPVAYLRMGAGEPVLLLHGGGLAAVMWRPLMMKLRESHDSIAPDLPRAGRGATAEEVVALYQDVIDESLALVEGRVHLVGHSYGGGLALRASLRRPERVASLALVEPTLPALLRAAGETEALADMLAWRNRLDRASPMEAAQDFIEFWGGADFWRWLGPAAREGVAAWIAESAGPAWDHFYEVETIDLEQVRGVAAPTLIVSGDVSPLASRRTCEALGAMLPAAAHRRLTGRVGHMAPITHPQLVNAEITDHLRRHPRR